MIYSNYDESAIDFFADKKSYGIVMPAARSCMEQNMFISGVAESAMLTAFERIGASEKAYYESGLDYVEEGAVFDSIKEMFGKILEAIKKAYEKVVSWFAQKQAEVAKFFREKALDKVVAKIDKMDVSKDYDGSKVICKSNVYANAEGGKKATQDFNELQATASTKAKAASTFAKTIINGNGGESYDDSDKLKVEAVKTILGKNSADGSNVSEILKNYKNKFIADKQYDVTASRAVTYAADLKKVVLAGTQKYYIKKCYNEEKRAINQAVADLKKYSDKDDKTVKPKVAKCKDITMVMDAVYRTDMEIIQAQFTEARKILAALAKHASSVVSKADNAEKLKKSQNESANDFYMW